MDQKPTPLPYDLQAAKKKFSRIGFALLAFFGVSLASIFLIQFILARCFAISLLSPTASVILSSVGMYAFGAPCFFLILRRLPAVPPPRGKVHAGTLCVLFFIAYACMYVGNTLGLFTVAVLQNLTGFTLTSASLDLLPDLPWYTTAGFVVLIGPFFEELIFRKLILDRTRVYGEKTAIVFSALLFGFYHQNPQQFFYATFIGLVFGYLYLRTGKLSVCWLLHGLFNFFGGFLPSLLMQYTNYTSFAFAESPEAMMQIVTEDPSGFILVLLYSMLVLCFALTGIVLFFVYRKRLFFADAERTLPRDTEAQTTFVNLGVILFVVFCILWPFIEQADIHLA